MGTTIVILLFLIGIMFSQPWLAVIFGIILVFKIIGIFKNALNNNPTDKNKKSIENDPDVDDFDDPFEEWFDEAEQEDLDKYN